MCRCDKYCHPKGTEHLFVSLASLVILGWFFSWTQNELHGWKCFPRTFWCEKQPFKAFIGHKKSQTIFLFFFGLSINNFFWLHSVFIEEILSDSKCSFYTRVDWSRKGVLLSKLSHEKFRLSKTFHPVWWAIDVGWKISKVFLFFHKKSGLVKSQNEKVSF